MYIQQNAFTAIAPIKEGHIPALREALLVIQNDIEDSPFMPFRKMKTIHFARWFIMDNIRDTDGELYPPMLGFSSNYDGDLDTHLKEVMKYGVEGVDAIYKHCKGYPEGEAVKDIIRINYLKAYSEQPKLFWGSKFGYGVSHIQGEGVLRDAIQAHIESTSRNIKWSSLTPKQIREQIIAFVKGEPSLKWALNPVGKTSLGWKIKYYGKIILILLLLLLCLPLVILFLAIWIPLGRYYEKVDDKIRANTPVELEPAERYQELVAIEDRIFQNQMTIYGTIKKPYWFKRTTLKIALTIFSLNGAYRSTKGKLSGIPTIHFARWVMFNNDRNVMFLSNYNGNWENYLSEFIERSADAMNVSFGTMAGYPQVKWFIKGGAHDEQKFKALVRKNQYPSQVYYSAYPNLSVRNILNNAEIRKGLYENLSDEEINTWVMRLF